MTYCKTAMIMKIVIIQTFQYSHGRAKGTYSSGGKRNVVIV